MSSSYLPQFLLANYMFDSPRSCTTHDKKTTDNGARLNSSEFDDHNNLLLDQFLALLHPARASPIDRRTHTTYPHAQTHYSPPNIFPSPYETRHDSVTSAVTKGGDEWSMYQTSMGGPVASATRRPLKRAKTHERTPSASTIASNGPASPYSASTSYPHIANTDYSPNSPAHYVDQTLLSKIPLASQHFSAHNGYIDQSYIPRQFISTPNGSLSTQDFAFDYSNAPPISGDFIQAYRNPMSSDNASPATPQSGSGEWSESQKLGPMTNDFRQSAPSVQLSRTASQGHPDNYNNSAPQQGSHQAQTNYLTPHRNLVSERLQTANLARSTSPSSAVSRERSPFRANSPLAPAMDWGSAVQAVGTAAGRRQQQRDEAAQAEVAQHQPKLRREPTKTISPKDALLDYNEPVQAPLFHDTLPAGYRQHTGGTETWQNNFVSQPGSTFGNLSAIPPNYSQMVPFRASSSDGWADGNLDFIPIPPAPQDAQTQMSNTNFQNGVYNGSKMPFLETNPEFPTSLTRMESSVSENGPPLSSQEDVNNPDSIRRPSDTRANTGTYTCTYHGCTQRFESHVSLQRHKREYHRSHQQPPRDRPASTSAPNSASDSDSNSASGDASARSTESPGPPSTTNTVGMTSAAILARNSQAGPHRCSRINPSTGKPCNVVFSRPYDLTRHEDTIHNNRKHKVRCPMCREEKTFSRNDALTRHMRVVHPEVESFGKRSRRE